MVILDSFPSPPNLNYLILVFSELLTGLSLTEICINNFWTAPIQQQCSGMPLPFASHLLTVHHAHCVQGLAVMATSASMSWIQIFALFVKQVLFLTFLPLICFKSDSYN